MKILKLPHRTADYLCPVNGLCDIYEWKTQSRIPDELIFYCQMGFQVITNKNLIPPKMIFLSSGTLKSQYEFWQDIMGYKIYQSEGKAFTSVMTKIKKLIDNDVPVILFGLDMYHLAYQEKFYQNIHIPGHIVLLVGYDDNEVYVQDNSKTGIQTILNNDLRLAWAEDYEGFSRKNTYFGIEFEGTILNDKTVIEAGLKGMSKRFLEPTVGFMGTKGITSLIKELSLWSNTYNSGMITAIYKHFITFTGSVLPELPKELDEMNSGINNPHRGSRDLMAKALRTYASQYGNDNWKRASVLFEKSGNIINQISNHMVKDILNSYFTDTAKYVELFGIMQNYETEAFHNFLL
ncbi:BtrH N-terminal domain-containing protein [Clostridium sp. FP1]|uniref:BtrH N-terminal domain-containing protein n=1 Tax=Clostridium sp. FP1 TaxID=2724076 RepID=UPI0013E92751|nr:BtrH N-terminal domain-containing protein [Clostridium sp. FP1]MBZ9637606.1 BtrH N-terminal domain-containing protein [Clostridium sp. FP1]